MKKRRVLPVVAVGGLLAFLASQFISINIGVSRSDTDVVDPESEQTATSTNAAPAMVDSGEPSSPLEDAKFWLVDVLIDGDRYSARRITEQTDEPESIRRKTMTLEEVVSEVEKASGDASGTKVRISRTPEAIASAERELTVALEDAGVTTDAVVVRQRLVE